MKSYKKIVKEMFSANKGLLGLTFIVVLGLIALQIAIPLCMNRMIDTLDVQNTAHTFYHGCFTIYSGIWCALYFISA